MISKYLIIFKNIGVSETLLHNIYYVSILLYFILSSYWFKEQRKSWIDVREVDSKSKPRFVWNSHKIVKQKRQSTDDSLINKAEDPVRSKSSLDECPKSEWCSWPFWRKRLGARFKYEVAVYRSPQTCHVIYRDGFQYPPTCTTEGYWYHATDRDSAEDILGHGIELDFGRGMQDFSHKDGFYVSPLFKNAVNWACNQTRENPAIIVFKLKFDLEIFRVLDLSYSRADWEMIIKYNRSGRQTTGASSLIFLDQDLLERFENSDYVVGPVNGGKAGVRCANKDWNNWRPSGFQRPHQQLCIRRRRLAEVFGDIRNIDAVIFYC